LTHGLWSFLSATEVAIMIVPLWQKYGSGVLLTATLAGAASVLSYRYGAPAMLLGLLLGMAFHFASDSAQVAAGAEFLAGTALRLGVALLGARLAFSDLAQLGWEPIVFLVFAVGTTILSGVVCARMLGVESRLGVLTGGSVAICGASAAMAISSVLPETEERRHATLFTVIGVASLSTFAMIFYPVLGDALGMNDEAMGFFIGATIHDVAQVVGAGYSVSTDAGDLAVMVKLFRVAMLIPVVAAIAVVFARARSDAESQSRLPKVPLFLLGFLALFGLNTAGVITAPVISLLSTAASVLLLLAITALGIRTSLREVLSIGFRPIILLCTETAVLAALVLGFLFWSPS
jgi:uncharacterized integral membrane protein (TIGR00698 family)